MPTAAEKRKFIKDIAAGKIDISHYNTHTLKPRQQSYENFTDQELMDSIRICEKRDRGEALTPEEQEYTIELSKKIILI